MPMPRTEVTKKIWDYIKKNKLQDAVNRRLINADDKLTRRVRRQEQGLDVRDDEAGLESPEVTGNRSCARSSRAHAAGATFRGTPAEFFYGPKFRRAGRSFGRGKARVVREWLGYARAVRIAVRPAWTLHSK